MAANCSLVIVRAIPRSSRRSALRSASRVMPSVAFSCSVIERRKSVSAALRAWLSPPKAAIGESLLLQPPAHAAMASRSNGRRRRATR